MARNDRRAYLVHLWQRETWRELHIMEVHGGERVVLALSADGKRLAVGANQAEDCVWAVWDVGRNKERWRHTQAQGRIEALAFTPDGKSLATATASGVQLCRVEDGKEVRSIELPRGFRLALLDFAPDGRTLAVAGGSEKPAVLLVETATGKTLAEFTGHRGAVTALAFSPDGKTLASGSTDTTILLWNVAEKRRE
jgi:WD40 repeat protein